MQKLVYRSSYANKYAARKLAKQKLLDDRKYQTKDRLELKQVNQRLRKHNKLLHQERWDSVYRGQLAPRYDVGDRAERWGTVDLDFTKQNRVPEKRRITCPFAVNDRVALVASGYRDRGKIGKVLDINEETQSIKVEGIELANIYQMDYMRTLQQTQAPAEVAPQPIPFKDLRLVYPLVHPDTGALRDVIINEVSLRKPNGSEKKAGLDKPIRSIAGLMPLIELPYPEVKEPQYEDHDSDTLRIEVEQLTWTPTLGVPPMPRSIIDELRNKYSVFRTRYDDAFIARKEAAAKRADEKRKALKTAARTPLDEINFAKRDGLRKINIEAAEGGAWKPLTSEIIEAMARIGLESEEKTGRKLPGRAREQFELIQQGFTDDPIPDEMVSEAADEDEKGLDEDDGDEESEWVDYPEEKAKP